MPKTYYEFDSETNEIAPIEKEKALEKAKGIFSRVDKWKLFKQLSATVASGCASAVVVKCAENSMPSSMTFMEKVVAKVGLYFISGLVSSKVSKMVESDLDSWKDALMKNVAEQEDEKELNDGGAEA